MASALEKIMKGTLQKSEAQKAFNPWWEDLEDKLLYGTMILGMISLPFNMVSNTPVECTLNQDHPSFRNLSLVDQSPMRYHHFYLRKFCTMNFIHDSMVFLPFLLILCPLPLVGIERMCLRFFGVLKRMNAFYTLLVKDSLDREDVEAFEKEKARSSHEILQMFRDSNGIYFAFIAKSIIQLGFGLLIASGLVFLQCFGLSQEEIHCQVFSQHYLCVVPLARFYRLIVVLATTAMFGYVVCTLYTLLWITCSSHLSSFHRFMGECQDYVRKCIHEPTNVKHHVPKPVAEFLGRQSGVEPFFDVFFDKNSRDLGLLITLLACSNGVAEGLRLVSLFDKDYQMLWKPVETQISHDPFRDGVILVEWTDAPLAPFVHHRQGQSCNKMNVEYTLEIVPPDSEAPLKNRQFQNGSPTDSQFKYKEHFFGVAITYPSKPRLAHQPFSIHTVYDYEPDEDNLSTLASVQKKPPNCDVKIVISSEINGRTIAQITKNVPPAPHRADRESLISSKKPLDRVASTILEKATETLPLICASPLRDEI
ncbi:uncharacterized protein LOC131887897 isoform X2 [Tigriopus californicus]|uniref:uncharacterized protein LOC131887897 isoform X2 n=1 Tax=Tigriopus californicus TaxID=6832 RepID=UPI0027DA7015|nr:uncharacterized protein LOC131887897 isoform X2 [Tigriopus californicus]